MRFELGLAQGVAGKKDGLLFVVYGGGKDVKLFCMDNGLIHISEQEDSHKLKRPKIIQPGFMFKEI